MEKVTVTIWNPHYGLWILAAILFGCCICLLTIVQIPLLGGSILVNLFDDNTRADRVKLIEQIHSGNPPVEIETKMGSCELPRGCSWKNSGKDYLVITVTNKLSRDIKHIFAGYGKIQIKDVSYPSGASIPTCDYTDREIAMLRTQTVYCAPYEIKEYDQLDKQNQICLWLQFPGLYKNHDTDEQPIGTIVCADLGRKTDFSSTSVP